MGIDLQSLVREIDRNGGEEVDRHGNALPGDGHEQMRAGNSSWFVVPPEFGCANSSWGGGAQSAGMTTVGAVEVGAGKLKGDEDSQITSAIGGMNNPIGMDVRKAKTVGIYYRILLILHFLRWQINYFLNTNK